MCGKTSAGTVPLAVTVALPVCKFDSVLRGTDRTVTGHRATGTNMCDLTAQSHPGRHGATDTALQATGRRRDRKFETRSTAGVASDSGWHCLAVRPSTYIGVHPLHVPTRVRARTHANIL